MRIVVAWAKSKSSVWVKQVPVERISPLVYCLGIAASPHMLEMKMLQGWKPGSVGRCFSLNPVLNVMSDDYAQLLKCGLCVVSKTINQRTCSSHQVCCANQIFTDQTGRDSSQDHQHGRIQEHDEGKSETCRYCCQFICPHFSK